MAHHNLTGMRLTSSVWISTNVSSKMRCTSSISLNVKSLHSNVSLYKVTCNVISFTPCGSFFPNRTLMDLPILRVGNLQLTCELWAHEVACCLFVNPWDIINHLFEPQGKKTWPWLKVTSLGHKALSNSWSAHQYDLPWYHKATF